jgi:glycosyltransferase involved in cell wall biosynthesis
MRVRELMQRLIVEAMAVGVPVLISRRVNIWREIVEDQAGFAADATLPGTIELLNQWIDCDASSRSQMRERARVSFQKRFHVDSASEKLLNILKQYVRTRKAST